MKITISKLVSQELELPKFFKLATSDWYYAIIDEKTLLHVKLSAFGYPLIEQVDLSIHSSVITGNKAEEITEQEFKEKFTKASLLLAELAN